MKDAGNIPWNRIPETARVVDLGKSYIADMGDGTSKLIYWSGHESAVALDYLNARVSKQIKKAKATNEK